MGAEGSKAGLAVRVQAPHAAGSAVRRPAAARITAADRGRQARHGTAHGQCNSPKRELSMLRGHIAGTCGAQTGVG
jgi:hypothetical protein